MSTVLHLETTVLPGHRLEITSPDLPEGAKVAVTVKVPASGGMQRMAMLDFLAGLPLGPRALPTWEAYEQHQQQEKDAWER